MPKWKEFRYAYKYHKKYSYSSEELEALHKATHLFSVYTDARSRLAKGTCSRRVIVAGLGGGTMSPEVYYWEIRIRYHNPRGLIWTGFESDEYRVLYSSDGQITGMSENTETYDVGDVVGCGITKDGYQVFFTKNGRRIATVKAEKLHHTLCRPFSFAAHKSTNYYINHGNGRFKFDIEAFSDGVTRASILARDLPPELFQRVFQHYLGEGTLAVSSLADIASIHRLSSICRYCYNICRTPIWHTVYLTSHREMSAAASHALLSRTQRLFIQEDARSPWLHILFTRSHPNSALTQNFTCDYSDCELRSPPHAPIDLHIFARSNRCNSLSKLKIRRRKFKSWTQFAKLVFSLPYLEYLVISDVDWGSSPKLPPSWLRFQGRLRSLRCSNIASPHLWLFIAGRPITGKKFWGPALLAGHISVLTQIFEAAMAQSCHLPISRLDCEHQADASYRLTAFSRPLRAKIIELTLVPVDENYHRLSNIWVREARADLPTTIELLSSAFGFETPEIDIEERKPGPPPVPHVSPTSTPGANSNTRLSLSKPRSTEVPRREERNIPDIPLTVLLFFAQRLSQELVDRFINVDAGLTKALSDAEVRAYTSDSEAPPESWEQPVQKRKIPQWDTRNQHGRKPTQRKGNVKRR